MSELTKALIQFHKDVDKIEKNARANYGKFADLANVLSTVTPALLKNGLVIVQTFLEDSLVTTLRHVGGEEISSVCKLFICEGRNVTQEFGKAVTYQRRYSIVSLLNLVADMDMDGAMLEESAPAAPAAKPEPKPAILDQPLNSAEKESVIEKLKELFASDKDRFTAIQKAFFATFPDLAGIQMSQAITTHAHSEMVIGELIK